MFGWGSDEVWIWVTFRLTMFRSSSGSVQVQITYGYHVWVDTGLVQVEFGSGLFRVIYSSPIQIGYGSSGIWVEWNSVQYLGQYQVRYNSDRV